MKKNEDNKVYAKEIKKKKYVNEDFKMARSFVIVLFVVVALIGLLFFFNGKYVTKDEFQNGTTTTSTTIPKYNDKNILVNHILTVSKDKYYVLVYDFEDRSQDVLYGALAYYYQDEKINLYSVDLGSKFNSSYYNKDKEASLKPKKATEFNFTGPVLLVINKNKVSEAITDKDAIIEKLKN